MKRAMNVTMDSIYRIWNSGKNFKKIRQIFFKENNKLGYYFISMKLHNAYLDHLRHIAFRPCVVCLILHSHQYYKIQIIPHIVFKFNVFFKGYRFVVKLVPFKPYRENESKCNIT